MRLLQTRDAFRRMRGQAWVQPSVILLLAQVGNLGLMALIGLRWMLVLSVGTGQLS